MNTSFPPRCILASGSMTRRRLLAQAGVGFDVVCPLVDEEALRQAMRGKKPMDVALRLAETKALQVSQIETKDKKTLIIGADQVLSFEGEIFGKVQDKKALRERLKMWQGRPHLLHTACVLFYEGEAVWHSEDEATLWVRPLSDEFIDDYLRHVSKSDLNTVGGYRLEKRGIQLFSRIKGDHTSILGLSLFPLLHILRQWGVVKA